MELPSHLYVFLTGNPHGGTFEPAFTTHGHFVLDVEAGTAIGNIIVKAEDGSFILHAQLVDGFTIDQEANLFMAELSFETIKGTSPFPDVITILTEDDGPVPLDEPWPTTAPNVFGYVSTSPPPHPPASNS